MNASVIYRMYDNYEFLKYPEMVDAFKHSYKGRKVSITANLLKKRQGGCIFAVIHRFVMRLFYMIALKVSSSYSRQYHFSVMKIHHAYQEHKEHIEKERLSSVSSKWKTKAIKTLNQNEAIDINKKIEKIVSEQEKKEVHQPKKDKRSFSLKKMFHTLKSKCKRRKVKQENPPSLPIETIRQLLDRQEKLILNQVERDECMCLNSVVCDDTEQDDASQNQMLLDICHHQHAEMSLLWNRLFKKFSDESMVQDWICTDDGQFIFTLKKAMLLWTSSYNEQMVESPIGGMILILGGKGKEIRGYFKDRTMYFDQGFHIYCKQNISFVTKEIKPRVTSLGYQDHDHIHFVAQYGPLKEKRIKTFEEIIENWDEYGIVVEESEYKSFLEKKIAESKSYAR